jgi:hypothetical protein
VRTRDSHPLVQLNHPRTGSGRRDDQNLFSHLSVMDAGLDPARLLDDPVNRALIEPGSHGVRDLDFDAMELLNGRRLRAWHALRADWFSLLLQGEIRTATANSDSHDPGELVALPRNYVRLAEGSTVRLAERATTRPTDEAGSGAGVGAGSASGGPGEARGGGAAADSIEAFDARMFIGALRAHRSFGTTGPFVDVRLGGTGVGDAFRGASGVLAVTAHAASWVPVSRTRVLVNGRVVEERACRAGETSEFALAFGGDSFVTVEVEGDADERFTALTDGSQPFAFTNPIFVDADSDGQWTASGIPDPIPDTLR